MGHTRLASDTKPSFSPDTLIRDFLHSWSDLEGPADALLALLHPLAFDLHLPEGHARSPGALEHIRRQAAARPLRPSYCLQRIGPLRPTHPPGGFRVAAMVKVRQKGIPRSVPPVRVIFEFRATTDGDLRIARVEPAG